MLRRQQNNAGTCLTGNLQGRTVFKVIGSRTLAIFMSVAVQTNKILMGDDRMDHMDDTSSYCNLPEGSKKR